MLLWEVKNYEKLNEKLKREICWFNINYGGTNKAGWHNLTSGLNWDINCSICTSIWMQSSVSSMGLMGILLLSYISVFYRSTNVLAHPFRWWKPDLVARNSSENFWKPPLPSASYSTTRVWMCPGPRWSFRLIMVNAMVLVLMVVKKAWWQWGNNSVGSCVCICVMCCNSRACLAGTKLSMSNFLFRVIRGWCDSPIIWL